MTSWILVLALSCLHIVWGYMYEQTLASPMSQDTVVILYHIGDGMLPHY